MPAFGPPQSRKRAFSRTNLVMLVEWIIVATLARTA